MTSNKGNFEAAVLPNANCSPPTIPSQASSDGFYQCNNRLYTEVKNNADVYELHVLENSQTWSKVTTPAELITSKADTRYAVAVGDDKLYAIGGGGPNRKGDFEPVDDVWAFGCVKQGTVEII